jgi:hypothetical protein
MPDWTRLFPDADFRWPIGLRPADARAFFAPTGEPGLLAERARWLEEAPGDYALLAQEGAPLLAETAALAAEWGMHLPTSDVLTGLGRAWEPDFVLLACGAEAHTVVGGVVCFPSAWALREKLGQTLAFTHAPVPGLNEQLGTKIHTMLARLAPGAAWARENWGLARDAERNHHPARPRPRLDDSTRPEEVWLRIERQVLYKLPRTGGLLFGLRLEILPLTALPPEAKAGLARALATMPEEAARYKGFAAARAGLLAWLR